MAEASTKIKTLPIMPAASIVLNIAEGSGKWTKRDKANFYRISIGSAYECIGALDIMVVYGIVGKDNTLLIKITLHEIAEELQALIHSIEKRGY